MENLGLGALFSGVYHGKKVLITGHTGFKGSWLAYWLDQMGADVTGYSLEPPTHPSHYDLLNLEMASILGDIRNFDALHDALQTIRPDIVFHLAAQPLVRLSYENPIETYESNVMGTLHLLEACRQVGVKAIVNVSSDKCYENREWIWGYRENDPMGGYDPYSSSKGCAEILAASFRRSFFHPDAYGKTHQTLLASCRAGNVIGGGDWAKDRLMTDIVLSASRGEKMVIRNPYATRPWQHVLEPLSGYLAVGQRLLEERMDFAEGWNFGPGDEGSIAVEEVVKAAKRYWDAVNYEVQCDSKQPHEANLLKLDCSKAHIKLGWKGVWNSEETFEKTLQWYQAFYQDETVLTSEDLKQYITDAKAQNITWAVS